MALPADPGVTGHASVTTNDGLSKVTAVVTVTAIPEATKASASATAGPAVIAKASSDANYESSPTPKQKKTVLRNTKFLIVVFVAVFVIGMIFSWAATSVGALLLALGGAWTVIHRLHEENNVPLDDDSYNSPIALLGLGGVLAAGSAAAPLFQATRVLLGF